jgi:hypothetical protein
MSLMNTAYKLEEIIFGVKLFSWEKPSRETGVVRPNQLRRVTGCHAPTAWVGLRVRAHPDRNYPWLADFLVYRPKVGVP